jgi:hypothetical protein
LTRASKRIGAASNGVSLLLICDTNGVAPNSYVRPQGETVQPCAVFADCNAVNGGMTRSLMPSREPTQTGALSG